MRKISVILLSVLILIGCHYNGDSVVKQAELSASEESLSEEEEVVPIPEHTPEPEREIKKTESHIETINRPIITHKSNVVYFDDGQCFRDFSENVVSVIDAEDGNIPYKFIGGFVGPYSEQEIYELTHSDDNPRIAENRMQGFYFTIGWKESKYSDHNERICVTNAFDREGHASWKEYKIIFLKVDESSSIGTVQVNVDQLNVRNSPSKSGIKMGQVAINYSYFVYETAKADGYTWYRIGNDLWIADDGTWVNFE